MGAAEQPAAPPPVDRAAESRRRAWEAYKRAGGTMEPEAGDFESADPRTPVADLGLPTRARKGLARLGIRTLGELVSRTGDQLMDARNFGVTSVEAVRVALARRGLALKGEAVPIDGRAK